VAAGRGRGRRGATAPGRHCAAAVFGRSKYGILKFYTPNLAYCSQTITNAIVVTMRITIGDLIAGLGAATKTFTPGGKHPRAATI